MAKKKRLLLYGSYGFTGNLIAEAASGSGFNIILSGRDKEKLKAQSERLSLPYKKASLNSAVELDSALSDADLVLHCAGPFIHTWKPIAEACLRNNCHYLDITGEIQVFEALKALDASFKEKDLMAIPGAGFDVVPTDCMAAYLKKAMPDATHLELAFRGLGGGVSRGTAKTMVENLGKGGAIRENGNIVSVPAAYKTRKIFFQEKEEQTVSIPWGDISTAFTSTGIKNIVVYTAMPETTVKKMKWMNYLAPILKIGFVKKYLKRRIDKLPPGPNLEQRENGRSIIWGEVRNESGNMKEALLETAEGYKLTAEMALEIANRVLDGNFKAGYQTPTNAYGYDLIFAHIRSKWIKK